VSSGLVWSVVSAMVFGVAVGAAYVSWPRAMTAEEWVLHRRKMASESSARVRVRLPAVRLGRLNLDLARNRALVDSLERDARLVALGTDASQPNRAIGDRIRSSGVVGCLAGATVGLLLWVVTGTEGLPLQALVLAVLGAVVGPLAWVARLRLTAERMRASIRRRLPRLFTGARMLLESGAATPEAALTAAVGIFRDPAAELLREALRIRQVRRIQFEAALDEVAERYGVDELVRLADSYRMGGRYGTKMSDLLAEFSASLRHRWHADYRERITRAPVLMTVPALLFFVTPLLVLTLYLVFAPLSQLLTQI
jgi:Flp pilus assembly protein TadB